jgi:hypothetical protein
MRSVNNVPNENLDNRFAKQRAILVYLATVGQPRGDYIGHLPRTGNIVDALGYPRTKLGFASVSRSLARLCKAGKVHAYYPSRCTPGMGARYCLAADEGKNP